MKIKATIPILNETSSAWGLIPFAPGLCSMSAEGGEGEGGGSAAPAAGDAAAAGEAPAAGAAGGEAGGEGGEGGGEASGGEQVTSIAGGAGGEGKAAGEGEAGEGEAGKGEGEGGKITVLGAPEAYDLKAPEGMEFDTEAFAAVEPVLRELNLSGEAAQTLVSAYAEKVLPVLTSRAAAAAATQAEQANAAFRAELAAQAKADPEIGGANYDKTVDRVAQVWEQYGIKKGTGFRQLLDDSGLGNHPDMLRFLSRVGASVGEGSFVPSDAGGSGERPSDAKVFYPEQAKS